MNLIFTFKTKQDAQENTPVNRTTKSLRTEKAGRGCGSSQPRNGRRADLGNPPGEDRSDHEQEEDDEDADSDGDSGPVTRLSMNAVERQRLLEVANHSRNRNASLLLEVALEMAVA